MNEVKEFWKYLTTGTVKHLMSNDVTYVADCGVTALWYVPNGWKGDKEGLDKRRKCRGCSGEFVRINNLNVKKADEEL